MSENGQRSRSNLSRLYDFALRAHSEVPYRYLKSGYMLLAWH